jgi:ribosomal protein L31E
VKDDEVKNVVEEIIKSVHSQMGRQAIVIESDSNKTVWNWGTGK